MDYGDLFSGIRKNIFTLLHDSSVPLKFNQLKNNLKLRSNELSYHIKILLDSGLIERAQDSDNVYYSLSKSGKVIYPYLPIMLNEQKPIFVVACVALIKDDIIYFQRKPREPEKGSLIFFGGKVLSGKSIEETLVQYVKEQANCGLKDLKLRCVNEFMKKDSDYDFHNIVYFYTATPSENPDSSLICKKLSKLNYNELFWDNKFFIKENLNNEYPKITKTFY